MARTDARARAGAPTRVTVPAQARRGRPASGNEQAPVERERAAARDESDGLHPGQAPAWRRLLARHRLDAAYLLPLLVVTGLVARLGLTGAPPTAGEGWTTAQVFAVDRIGALAPADGGVTQSPLGSTQVAGWTALTDAFDRYDLAVIAAREAMVAFHVLAALLLWALARRLGLGRPASVLAVLVFGLSPLSVQVAHTVSLDNVALPWLLAAFTLALGQRRQLLAFSAAGLCFGVAVLSAAPALLALPFLAWQAWHSAAPGTRRSTVPVAGALLALLLTSYVVASLLTGGGVGRSPQPDASVGTWLGLDPVLPSVGALAALAALGVPRLRPIAAGLLVLTALAVAPGPWGAPPTSTLVAFAALLVGAVAELAVRRDLRWVTAPVLVVVFAAAAVFALPVWMVQLRGLAAAHADRPMREALSWVDDNVAPSQRLLVDDATRVDLTRRGFPHRSAIPAARADPVVAQVGWRFYDYLVLSPPMRPPTWSSPAVRRVLATSARVAVFGSGDDRVEIFRVDPRGGRELAAAEQRDRRARLEAGAALLGNRRLDLAPPAADALRAGQVDVRLLSALVQVTSEHKLSVAEFPDLPGEAGQLPRRTALVTAVDGESVDGPSGDAVIEVLQGQTGSFTAAHVDRGAGVLTVRFDVALPSDLLPAD